MEKYETKAGGGGGSTCTPDFILEEVLEMDLFGGAVVGGMQLHVD